MSSDDFQKGGRFRSCSKGGPFSDMEEKINSARKEFEKIMFDEALSILTEMNIRETVLSAIAEGAGTVCDVPFPDRIREKHPEDLYSGEAIWGEIINKRLISMLEEFSQAEIGYDDEGNYDVLHMNLRSWDLFQVSDLYDEE